MCWSAHTGPEWRNLRRRDSVAALPRCPHALNSARSTVQPVQLIAKMVRGAPLDYAQMVVTSGLPLLVSLPAFALMVSAGADPVVANVSLLAASSTVTYFLNQKVVFGARRPLPARSAVRYILVMLATVVLDVAAVGVVAQYTNDAAMLTFAKAAVVVPGAVCRFVLFRHWVFASSQAGPAAHVPE